MQRVTLAFLSVKRNVNEHECVSKHTQNMATMTHADKRKIKKADNARVFKAGGVCSEHSCRVAIIY